MFLYVITKGTVYKFLTGNMTETFPCSWCRLDSKIKFVCLLRIGSGILKVTLCVWIVVSFSPTFSIRIISCSLLSSYNMVFWVCWPECYDLWHHIMTTFSRHYQHVLDKVKQGFIYHYHVGLCECDRYFEHVSLSRLWLHLLFRKKFFFKLWPFNLLKYYVKKKSHCISHCKAWPFSSTVLSWALRFYSVSSLIRDYSFMDGKL